MTTLKYHNGTKWTPLLVNGDEVPPGGTTGQALTKIDSTDYATQWSDVLTQSTADTRYLNSATDTAAGPLYLPAANPTANLEAAHKKYVDDSCIGTWTTWTPVTGGLNEGNGVTTASYLRVGRTCHVTYGFVFGSSSSLTAVTATSFQLPFEALGWGANFPGWVYNPGGSPSELPAIGIMSGADLFTTNIYTFGYGTNESNFRAVQGGTTGAVPWQWGVNDAIYFEGVYITAS